MTTPTTTPVTGLIADNVIGFARALRAAGIPVGPGAVIDAMNALQAIDIGNRADVFTTLESIFVNRHEHALIFAQAFDLFFRAAEDWKHMLDSVPLPDHARKKPSPASRRVQEAFAQPSMREEASQVEAQEWRPPEPRQAPRAMAAGGRRRADPPPRRYQPDARGLRLDMRRTLRGSLRTGGAIIDHQRLRRIAKPRPILAWLDNS